MEKEKRIKELVEIINKASYAYYNTEKEIMTNYEWDALFDELVKLENETGIILEDSPTQRAGMETDFENEKEPHEFPALSLAKTKLIKDLVKWAKGKTIWAGWKLDGLTLVATYDNGVLTKLVTRGNGHIGRNVTFLADAIKGVQMKIKEKGHMVIRGEAVISYDDFERINATIEADEQYANARNLASGTFNLDKTRKMEAKGRCVQFIPFTLVYTEKEMKSWGESMDYLDSLGFSTVEREKLSPENMGEVIARWTEKVKDYKIPVDGMVIVYDDLEFASQGTVTNHHATNAGYAFKWEDTKAETTLRGIEWSCSVNSITPVALFDTVSLEGSNVSRASLCNISEMKRLGIGENNTTKLEVIKANKIIPKCVSAKAYGTAFSIPEKCPVCGAHTKIFVSGKDNTETLKCTNPDCAAKQLKKFERFVSKESLNVDGISVRTIARFINLGYIKTYTDIFYMDKYKDEIVALDGFGEKSYKNISKAVQKAIKNADYVRLLYSLCIPMIGLDAAKKILNSIGSTEFKNRIRNGKGFEDIDGIGQEKSVCILNWFSNHDNMDLFEKLDEILQMKEINPKKESADGKCSGLVFVITGDVMHYKNRKEFKDYVESQGGKVSGSVSKKTNYLVNNDTESESSKNRTAKELGVPIISEDEFIKMFN